MQVNGPSHIHGAQPLSGPHRIQPAEFQPATDRISFSDEIHISPEAELISRIREMPEIRADVVARVKSEIQAGTYETPHRLDLAMDRLLDELRG
jgi:negative regulator of flagellin synthesis FlgM